MPRFKGRYWLAFILPFLCALPSPIVEGADSINAQILHNLGNVDLWGLPRIKFNLGSTPELNRLGFSFVASHTVTPACGCGARSEWQITGLATCLYTDKNGNMAWRRPDGREIVFFKKNALRDSVSGWNARVTPDGLCVILSHPNGQEWRYYNGWLDRIHDPALGTVLFATDRESILQAYKIEINGNTLLLLKIEYSEYGDAQSMEFPNQKRNTLRWSDDHCLTRFEGWFCGGISLRYDGLLLKSWKAENGGGDSYAWRKRRNVTKVFSYGDPPVMLSEDKDFAYEYGTRMGINYIQVRDKTRGFVSETRMSTKGLVQMLPDHIIRARYKQMPDGRRALEDESKAEGK